MQNQTHTADGFKIIETKKFHHGNLILMIILDEILDIYSIEIYRDNDRSTHNLWGCFMNTKDAKKVFDRISL